jgi:hypothetical protein
MTRSIAPALLGLLACPVVHAASVPLENGFKLTVKGYIQAQLALAAEGERPVADGATGNAAETSYDVLRGQPGEADDVAINLRRARISFEGKYGDGLKGLVMIRGGENDDPRGQNSDRKMEIYRSFVAWGTERSGIYHEVKAGLDFVFAGDSGPTAAYALPFERPALTAVAAAYGSSQADGVTVNRYFDGRQTCISYFASGPWFNVGVDLGNGTSPDEIRDAYSFGENSGFFYGARVEFAPSKDLLPSARQESYVGADGTHLVFGIDYGADVDMHSSQGDLEDGTPDTLSSYDYTFFGPDVCWHWNRLTMVGDLKFTRASESGYQLAPDGTRSGDYERTADGLVWDVRAAYAFPLANGLVIEPAAGFGIADYDRDDDNEGTDPSRILSDDTNLDSGTTFDIGATLYINKHLNKIQVAYRSWRGEDPDAGQTGTPSASVFVIQQQVQF